MNTAFRLASPTRQLGNFDLVCKVFSHKSLCLHKQSKILVRKWYYNCFFMELLLCCLPLEHFFCMAMMTGKYLCCKNTIYTSITCTIKQGHIIDQGLDDPSYCVISIFADLGKLQDCSQYYCTPACVFLTAPIHGFRLSPIVCWNFSYHFVEQPKETGT